MNDLSSAETLPDGSQKQQRLPVIFQRLFAFFICCFSLNFVIPSPLFEITLPTVKGPETEFHSSIKYHIYCMYRWGNIDKRSIKLQNSRLSLILIVLACSPTFWWSHLKILENIERHNLEERCVSNLFSHQWFFFGQYR